MLQPPKGLRFLLESPKQFKSRQLGLNELECNGTVRILLLRFIDSAHSALANHPKNSIAANQRAGLESRDVSLGFKVRHRSQPRGAVVIV
jgi:hypothetical protein